MGKISCVCLSRAADTAQKIGISPMQTVSNPSGHRAVILGNGPSLRGFDFVRELEGYDTFGMNAAYRHWDKIGWYPTYYACTDPFVAMTHKDAIRRLMRKRDIYGIRAFFLHAVLIKALEKDGLPPCVISYPFWLMRNKLLRPALCAGSLNVGCTSLLWAASLGYRHIILLGIDANFPVPFLAEGYAPADKHHVKLRSTPDHNPNYFFDDYQQKGDVYGQSGNANYIHKRGWQNMPALMSEMDVYVVNANPTSKVEGFQKSTWEEAKIEKDLNQYLL
jgi:hypothetical protein